MSVSTIYVNLERVRGRHLGEGQTVGEALASTRREAIRAGVPTRAWAGLVALGNAECRVRATGSGATAERP